jgi:hypothetical protein
VSHPCSLRDPHPSADDLLQTPHSPSISPQPIDFHLTHRNSLHLGTVRREAQTVTSQSAKSLFFPLQVANALRNCCFDAGKNMFSLLRLSEVLLPALLLPLAGPKVSLPNPKSNSGVQVEIQCQKLTMHKPGFNSQFLRLSEVLLPALLLPLAGPKVSPQTPQSNPEVQDNQRQTSRA